MPIRHTGWAPAQSTDFASLEHELRAFVAARPRVRMGRPVAMPSPTELN